VRSPPLSAHSHWQPQKIVNLAFASFSLLFGTHIFGTSIDWHKPRHALIVANVKLAVYNLAFLRGVIQLRAQLPEKIAVHSHPLDSGFAEWHQISENN
jgi:hypothetical protein